MSYYTVERQYYLDRLNWTVDDANYSLADLQELLFKGVPQRDIIPKLIPGVSSTTVDTKIAAQAALDAAAFITPATVDAKVAAQHTVDNSTYAALSAASQTFLGQQVIKRPSAVTNTPLLNITDETAVARRRPDRGDAHHQH